MFTLTGDITIFDLEPIGTIWYKLPECENKEELKTINKKCISLENNSKTLRLNRYE